VYITSHATIGIMIGERIGNPVLGFFLGAFSHFICDMIPHGDTQFDAWIARIPRARRAVTYGMAILDLIAMLVMLWFISPTLILTPSVVATTIGTIAPDILWAWYDIAQWKLLAAYQQWHHCLHKVLPRDIPYWLGLLYQTLLVVTLVHLRS